MGIFDSIGNIVRGQLIDVIEWTDSTNNTIVHKYDMNGKEIMMGAQLTVRESQVAIFVNEGKLADVFQPGRYELSTANMPVMTALKAWKFGFNSPFKSDVYFVNTKQFLDCKWGTTNPVMMRDAEFGQAQAGGVEELEHGLVANRQQALIGHFEQAIGFVRREGLGERLGAFRWAHAVHRVVCGRPALSEPAVEAAPGGKRAPERAAAQALRV